jgi:hypothetical protein
LPSDRAVSQLSQARASLLRKVEKRRFWNIKIESTKYKGKLEKKYAHPPLDNYGQSCFVRSDFFKMMPLPDHKKL